MFGPAAFALLLTMARPAAGQIITLAEIADRVRNVNPELQTFIVDQVAEVRWLGIFRWNLRATIYAARPGSYTIVLHDPPSLLARLGSVFSDISSPEQVLADYRAETITFAKGRLVVDLVGRHQSVNPPRVRAQVDPARWLIEEIAGYYEWGDLVVSYRYGDVAGFLLPVAARARIPQFFVSADLIYENYRLNVPIPAGTFRQADP